MFVQFPVNVITFEPFLIYSSNLICLIHVSDEFGTGALVLDHQGQIGFQPSTFTGFSLHLQAFLSCVLIQKQISKPSRPMTLTVIPQIHRVFWNYHSEMNPSTPTCVIYILAPKL